VRGNGGKVFMLDQVSLGVSISTQRRFYDAVLRLLGVVRIVDFAAAVIRLRSAPGSLGVEFTITSERGVARPIRGSTCAFARLIARRCGLSCRRAAAAAVTRRAGTAATTTQTTIQPSYAIPTDIASKP